MANDFRVGEDWTDSDKDLNTTGTLASGDQTVTGTIDASGEITGASIVQGSDPVLDESDLVPATIVNESEIVNTGPSAPSSTFAGKLWFDTANNLFKIRNEADNGWLDIWDTANDKPIIDNLVDEVLGTMLADAVAGDGLIKDGSENLEVNVDDSSIEISGDALQVKALGITGAMLETSIAAVNVSADDTTEGYLDGKLIAGDNVTLVVGSPAGDETLTVDTKFRGALVYLGSDFSVADGTPDSVDWDNEEYDTDDFHESVTNPERLTVPASVSRIKVSAQLIFDNPSASTSNQLIISIKKNGATGFVGRALFGIDDLDWTNISNYYIQLATPVLFVNETDYFTIEITWNDNTGAEAIQVVSGAGNSYGAIEVIE